MCVLGVLGEGGTLAGWLGELGPQAAAALQLLLLSELLFLPS